MTVMVTFLTTPVNESSSTRWRKGSPRGERHDPSKRAGRSRQMSFTAMTKVVSKSQASMTHQARSLSLRVTEPKWRSIRTALCWQLTANPWSTARSKTASRSERCKAARELLAHPRTAAMQERSEVGLVAASKKTLIPPKCTNTSKSRVLQSARRPREIEHSWRKRLKSTSRCDSMTWKI